MVFATTLCVRAGNFANGPNAIAMFPNNINLCRTQGAAVSDQWLMVWNAGTGVMAYTLTETTAWITSVTPSNGISIAGTATAHRVSIDATALAPGVQKTTISILSPGTTNAPQDVSVWIDTLASGTFGNVFLRHVITNTPGAGTVDNQIAADLDRDGLLDVVAAYANVIAWWRQEATLIFTNMQIIDGNFTGAMGVDAGDIDNDGDNDVVGAAQSASTIAWWENNGRMQFVEHTINASFAGARRVQLVDLDHDSDLDIVAAADNAGDIAWWRNDGNGVFRTRP